MAKLKLRGKDLRKIGFAESVAVGVGIRLMHLHYKHSSKTEALKVLADVLAAPETYTEHPQLGELAQLQVAPAQRSSDIEAVDFVDNPLGYNIRRRFFSPIAACASDSAPNFERQRCLTL